MARQTFPYKGLAYYREEDAGLFAGRDEEIEKCVHLIRHAWTSLFVVHGLSGCGKSSFLRAGLIPNLKRPGTDTAGIVPVIEIAPSRVEPGGPLSGVALGLYKLAVRLKKDGCDAPAVRDIADTKIEQFTEAHEDNADKVYRTMIDVTLATPRLPILFLDQSEDIVRGHILREDATPFFDLMARLCTKPVDVRICVAMRSEYKALFDDYITGAKPYSLAGYYLRQMSEEQIRKAILQPAREVKDPPWEPFEITDRAVDELLLRVSQKQGVLGGPLIAAQLMCDRLYRYAIDGARPKKIRGLIRFEDVLALGDPNDQIVSHLQDSLFESFREVDSHESLDEYKTSRSDRVDAWLDKLCALVVSAPDGRASSGSCGQAELLPAGENSRIVAHLCKEQEYILREQSDGKYCLVHDSVALALRRWKEANPAEPHPGEGGPFALPAAAGYGLSDREPLWTAEYPQPDPLRLSTLDDTIWDHLLLAYAERCGFTKRLGVHLEQEERFQWRTPGRPGDDLYQEFFHSKGPHIAVLPLEIVQPPKEWQRIAVTNVFRGYALTVPVGGLPDNPEVRAFDPNCQKFGQLLLPMLFAAPPEIELFPANEDDPEGDAFYHWLIKGPNRLGVGPAPTRARWRQTGRFEEWDIKKALQALATPPDLARKIGDLSMHEVCVVSGLSEPAWHYRIAALVFFTVEFILNNLAGFVRYLYDYERDLRRGRIAVSRDAIREMVSKSYSYSLFDSYAHSYLWPLSDDIIRDTELRGQIQSLYVDLLEFRKQYDDLLLAIEAPPRVRHDGTTAALLEAAARHYRIYNYYDAAQILKKVVRRLKR
jgi:hypothetical protein